MGLVRTNVTLSRELLREIDSLAGPRGRSAYVADAVTLKVKRDRLRRALDEARGVMKGSQAAMSPEEVVAWVDETRRDDRDPWA